MTYSKYLNSTLSIVHRVPAKLTPICAAILLSGCMGSEEYKTTEKVVYEKQQYQDKGGVAGRVIGKGYIEDATVCFDRNLDGVCNSSEDKTTSFENGKFSFTEKVSTENVGHILLAEVNASGGVYILAAKPNATAGEASNITLFTTLVAKSENNVLSDDLIINTNLEDNALLLGRDYVENVDVDSLTDEQKKKRRQVAENAKHLVKSYIKAYSLNETEPFKTVDFVVREVNSQKTFALSFSVTLDEPTPTNFTPTISLEGEKNVSITVGSTYEELGATAVDSLGNPLDVTVSGTVNTDAIGIFVILYSVEDTNGNTATDSREVTVIQPTSTPQVTSSKTIAMPVPGKETYQIDVVDADSNAFTYFITTQPSQLLATVDDSGLVTFSNFGDYQQDSFIIEVSDGENTVSETITIEASINTVLTFSASTLKTRVSMSQHTDHGSNSINHEYLVGATLASETKKLVTFSRWHNKLNVFDVNSVTENPVEDSSFNYLWAKHGDGGRDSDTGASGQDITEIIASHNGDQLFSLVETHKDMGTTRGKNSEGIYRLDLHNLNYQESDDEVRFATSATKQTDKFYFNENLSDIALSSDGLVLVASESKSSLADKKIIRFNNPADLSQSTSFSTDGKGAKSVALNNDGSVIYAGISKNYDNKLKLYNNSGQSLGVLEKDTVPELSNKHPGILLPKESNELFFVIERSSKIYWIDASNPSDIQLKRTFSASEKVKKLSLVSFENNDYLLAVEGKKIELFDLGDENVTSISSVTLANNVQAAYQVSDTTVAVVHGTNNGHEAEGDYYVTYYNLRKE